VSELVRRLDLAPHPEGGWFRETYRSDVWFSPDGYDGPRRAATIVLFALHPGERSHWHVVRSDEIWLWQSGGPLTLRLGGSGPGPVEASTVVLGPDLTSGLDSAGGQQLQALVPGGVWQSAEPAGSDPVVVSCVVAPGFEYADFRLAPESPGLT
jgi:predicted cupin superfamily sugar epimerase